MNWIYAQEILLSRNHLSGTVSSSLCSGSLTRLELEQNHLACFSKCLLTIQTVKFDSDVITCRFPNDLGLCALIASTNVASFPSYSSWNCGADGVTTSDPCGNVTWPSLFCDGQGQVITVQLDSVGLTGKRRKCSIETFFMYALQALFPQI